MNFDLENLFTWFKDQVQYILFFVLIIVLISSAFKRAWIGMIGSLLGLAFIGIFVANPNIILDVSEWIAGKVSLK